MDATIDDRRTQFRRRKCRRGWMRCPPDWTVADARSLERRRGRGYFYAMLVRVLAVLAGWVVLLRVAAAADAPAFQPAATPNLVKQANSPISNILQLRLVDSYIPSFKGADGQGNALTMSMTMPLPENRLLPRPQLSLLSLPTAVTTPDGTTGLGDLRFVDVVVLKAGPNGLWGVGPTFVFPTASEPTTGQAKWQLGPAAAVAFFPGRWLFGALAQNPISFAGDRTRSDTNGLYLQPFVTYQFGGGWFVRSQPQMFFNWKTGRQVLPLDAGAGRVFDLGHLHVNLFVEPFWNLSSDGPTPEYGVTFGAALLFPDFWSRVAPGLSADAANRPRPEE